MRDGRVLPFHGDRHGYEHAHRGPPHGERAQYIVRPSAPNDYDEHEPAGDKPRGEERGDPVERHEGIQEQRCTKEHTNQRLGWGLSCRENTGNACRASRRCDVRPQDTVRVG